MTETPLKRVPAVPCSRARLVVSFDSRPAGTKSKQNSMPVTSTMWAIVSKSGLCSPDSSFATRGWLTPSWLASVVWEKLVLGAVADQLDGQLAGGREPLPLGAEVGIGIQGLGDHLAVRDEAAIASGGAAHGRYSSGAVFGSRAL